MIKNKNNDNQINHNNNNNSHNINLKLKLKIFSTLQNGIFIAKSVKNIQVIHFQKN